MRATWRLLAAAIVLVTLGRVVATYHVFSQAWDENIHVAGGHEWLTSPTYRIDPSHPPLARILFSLQFRHIPPAHSRYENFSHLLFGHDGRYMSNLAHARLGNLPFLLLALIATGLWTRRLFGDGCALIAMLIVGSLPPILAHAGFTTTDLPAAATFLFALYALDVFLDAPTWRSTILLGVAIGMGLTAKFSFVVFFPLAALAMLVVRRKLPSLRIVAAAAIAFLFVWGVYKFAWGTMEQEYAGMTKVVSPRLATLPMPAPAFLLGMISVAKHDARGHPAFLLGRNSQHGWRSYFPIAVGVKTPIAVLLLFLAGAFALIRDRGRIDLVLIVAAILLAAMASHINIGIRHVLPLYLPMAMVAARGAVAFPRMRLAAAALLAWLVAGSAIAHPDYLPWFNAFGGREPYHILVDSNFDWGQDELRLVRVLRKRHIESLGASLFTSADPRDVGLPPATPVDWYTPSNGWIAISETNLQVAKATDPRAYGWLTNGRACERIGCSIRLYQR